MHLFPLRRAARTLAAPLAPRKSRSLRVLLAALLATTVVFGLTACGPYFYKFPANNFDNRPIPPSLLAQRVMVALTVNGSQGSLQILDAKRDIRNNVPNTIPAFAVSGFRGAFPTTILSFPEQTRGYVYSNNQPDAAASSINYGTETAVGSAGLPMAPSASLATAPDFVRVLSADERDGQLILVDNSIARSFAFNLPNVYKVALNRGDTVGLAMVRNSNALYRIVRLNPNAPAAPGSIDCQPTILPVYCVVPVPGNFDRPVDVSFSVDGAQAYVLNCGLECGGGTNGGAGVSFIPLGALQFNNVPTAVPYPAAVTNTVPIPGGVTTALSDGTNLYLAGQQIQPDGLFAGNLTTLNLTTLAPSAPVSISDGYHSKLLFAEDNTLWIGSQFCTNGERAKQGLNANCLTRYDLGTKAAAIVPAINPGSATQPASVPYPNSDNNLTYLGSLTGICWVQTFHKVYTAYGGQVHVFSTVDGSEINNVNVTVQGTALDVAYMDALTNSAN